MIKSKIRSIHSQLTLIYTVAVVLLLVILAFAFYWETQNLMIQADNNFVNDEATNMQSIMADPELDKDLLKKAVIDHPIRTRNSLYRYYIRVVDNKNNVIIETPGMSQIIPMSENPAVKEVVTQNSGWRKYADSNYIVNLAPIQIASTKQQGYVQVALDTSHQHAITHDRRIFVFFLLLGMALSYIIGRVVTNRGLRSLDVLTNTVKNISTSSLNHRVDPDAMPTELAVLAKAFNQMLDRIETSFANMHRMSADMSHELRTPITNLIGQTELLLSYEHTEDDLRNTHSSNLEELQRIASLIENILFLSRAESQLPDIDKQNIDVAAEVNKVCEYFQVLSEDKNIQITAEGHAKLHANAVMFRRLMSNLVSNAVKYTPQNGYVRVSIKEENKNVIITVSDNGIGILAQHLPRLFDRFYRVDDSRSAQIAGTGLGLSIVKSIVDLHHGSVSIESELNVGTTIIVTLPAS